MNQRILELAEQAREYATTRHPVSNIILSVNSDLFEQKFAELIVRECAEQSMSIGRYNTPSNITPDLAIAIAVGLKKHFGVEK